MTTGETVGVAGGLLYLGTQAYGAYTRTPFWLQRDSNMPLRQRVDYLSDHLLHPSAYVAGPLIVYDDARSAVNKFAAQHQPLVQRGMQDMGGSFIGSE